MKHIAVLLAAAVVMPDLNELKQMSARFAPVTLKYDESQLSPGDRKALPKLVEAARVLNFIFMDQLWSGNRALYAKLSKDTTPLGKERLHYFWLNKGPWSDLDGHTAFIPDVPERKPLGANFYPEDMTREEFEAWAKPDAKGFFTVIRRDAKRRLTVVPYSKAYAADLQRAAALLREAAALTDNASLKKYLNLRADAFLSNDYYASDVAWMEVDAPLDITIGPYETYNDELFGYKAGFEAYVTIRDQALTNNIRNTSARMQEIENNLPIDPKYRNPKIGAAAPIRAVDEVYAAGDGAHGVRTAAFNLPNDERVIREKGSKRVMLKNVQEAKFDTILKPIAARVLPKSIQEDVGFDAFFSHVLAHEMCHGIGPHNNVRQNLKELYSAIEEAKADVAGLFMMQYLYDHNPQSDRGPYESFFMSVHESIRHFFNPASDHKAWAERHLYTTFLASAFRSVRFGITEAHGRGMALQFNYLTDKGAFVAQPDGTFTVDIPKTKVAVRDLTHDLMTIEAEGNYAQAKRMLDSLAVIRPPMQRALDRLKDIPTDIDPVNEN